MERSGFEGVVTSAGPEEVFRWRGMAEGVRVSEAVLSVAIHDVADNRV